MRKLVMFGMLLGLVFVISFGLVIQPAGAAKYVMKFASSGVETLYTKHGTLQSTMKQFIETASNGQIEVQIFAGGQLGGFRETLEQVNLNTLEACTTSAGGIASFFPEIQVTDLPYHLSGEILAEMFSQSPFWIDMGKAILEKTGNIRFAAASRGGFRNIATIKGKPVKTIEDMKGLKIRTINSDVQQEFVKLLGASATPIGWMEVYTSLKTGVVDGLKIDIPTISPYKLPVYNIFADKHAPLYDFVWVSDKWLKKLPKDLQIVVINGIRAAARASENLWKTSIVQNVKELKKKGVNFVWPTEETLEPFVNATREPLRKKFVKKYGDHWLKKFDTAIESTKKGITTDANNYLEW